MASREHINDYFNGRTFMVLCAMALVVTCAIAMTTGTAPLADSGHGIFFKLPQPLIADAGLSALVNVVCILLTGAVLLAINKVFTFVRSMTHLFVSAFFLLQLAHPSAVVSLNAGTLLCLLTTAMMLPLFASFQDSHCQRSIFLIFTLAVTSALFHYGSLVLIPVFLFGFGSMRALGVKGLLAMFFGIITPFWIALGLGIVSTQEALLPQWQLLVLPQMNLQFALVATTALLGIVLAVVNLLTIMNYRIQPRVYNIFLIVLLLAAIIAVGLDYSDLSFFLPLLNLMVAVQIAQAFSLSTSLRYRYVFILLFAAACLAAAIVQLMP